MSLRIEKVIESVLWGSYDSILNCHLTNNGVNMSLFDKKKDICRICLNYEFSRYIDRMCEVVGVQLTDQHNYDCSICGKYTVSGIAWWQLPITNIQFIQSYWKFVPFEQRPPEIQQYYNSFSLVNTDNDLSDEIKILLLKMRSAVSHKFKSKTISGELNEIFGNDRLFEHFENCELPSQMDQLMSTITLIGDYRKKAGFAMSKLPVDFHSIIGAINRDTAFGIVKQLIREGLVDCETSSELIEECSGFYLTFNGMKKFEEIGREYY